MGNDIFGIFITRKKNMIVSLTELFLKYTVGEKAKLNKEASCIIDIYIESFYCGKSVSEIENPSVKNIKEKLLKSATASTIQYYKENFTDVDMNIVIILSNCIYLSLLLDRIFGEERENEELDIIDKFVSKYISRIKLYEGKFVEDLIEDMTVIWKKEAAAFKKFFRSIDGIQFRINIDGILDFYNGYMVSGVNDIKSLSKYSNKEVERALANKSNDMSLITLELTVLQLVKDFMNGDMDTIYFIPLSISVFEKNKYREVIDNIMQNEILKSHIVFVLNYKEIKDNQKLISNSKYQVGVRGGLHTKLTAGSLKHIRYVFADAEFIEDHIDYIAAWQTMDIKFIIGGCHE